MISLNTWHEYIFVFDNDAETAMLIWDDQLVAAATDYHFPLAAGDHDSIPIFIKHNAECFIKNVEVGTKTLAAARTTWRGEADDIVTPEPTETYIVTVDGVANEYAEGEVAKISAVSYKVNDMGYATRFNQWTGDVEGIEDVTSATIEIAVTSDITIDSTYFVIGDVNEDGKVNSMDSLIAKKLSVGGEGADATAQQKRVLDINFDGKFNPMDNNLIKKIITGYRPAK